MTTPKNRKKAVEQVPTSLDVRFRQYLSNVPRRHLYILGIVVVVVGIIGVSLIGKNDKSVSDSPHSKEQQAINDAFDNSAESTDYEQTYAKQQEARAAKSAKVAPHITSSVRTDKDESGYMFEKTIRMSGWVKGSDTDTLTAIWNYFGQNGTYDKANDNDMVLIGTFDVRNTTNGFSITDKTPYTGASPTTEVNIDTDYVDPDDGRWVKTKTFLDGDDFIVHYSTGDSKSKVGYSDKPNTNIIPKMTSDSWGPVVFSMIVRDAITPNHPTGSPEISQSWYAACLPLYCAGQEKVPLKVIESL